MLVKVRVFPGSKKEQIIKKADDALEVKVKEKPFGGKANQRTGEIMASYFSVPLEKVRLVRGHKQRNKIFKVSL